VWYAQEVLHLSKKVLSHTTKGCGSFLSPPTLKLPKGVAAVERVGLHNGFHPRDQIYPMGIAYT